MGYPKELGIAHDLPIPHGSKNSFLFTEFSFMKEMTGLLLEEAKMAANEISKQIVVWTSQRVG